MNIKIEGTNPTPYLTTKDLQCMDIVEWIENPHAYREDYALACKAILVTIGNSQINLHSISNPLFYWMNMGNCDFKFLRIGHLSAK